MLWTAAERWRDGLTSVKAWSPPTHTHTFRKTKANPEGLGVAVLAHSSQLFCLFQEGHTLRKKVKRALKCVQQLFSIYFKIFLTHSEIGSNKGLLASAAKDSAVDKKNIC